MKDIIYAEELGIGLKVEGGGATLRVAIVRFGNSPNESEEITSATIADYRVKNQLLPIVEAVAESTQN